MKKLAALTLCLLITHAVLSQVITGEVTDEQNIPLDAATVHVADNHQSLTDEKGRFFFKNIKPGTYEVKVSMIGYETQVKKVEVKQDEKAWIEFQLSGLVNSLSEVEVFGERNKQPEKLDAVTRLPLKPSDQ